MQRLISCKDIPVVAFKAPALLLGHPVATLVIKFNCCTHWLLAVLPWSWLIFEGSFVVNDKLCCLWSQTAQIHIQLPLNWVSLVGQLVKNLPAMWETWVQSLGWEDPGRGKGYPL